MPDPEQEEALRQLVRQVTSQDTAGLGLDTDLVRELGLDSLAGLRVLAAVEKRFAVRFPDEQLADIRSLRQVLAHIEGSQSGRP